MFRNNKNKGIENIDIPRGFYTLEALGVSMSYNSAKTCNGSATLFLVVGVPVLMIQTEYPKGFRGNSSNLPRTNIAGGRFRLEGASQRSVGKAGTGDYETRLFRSRMGEFVCQPSPAPVRLLIFARQRTLYRTCSLFRRSLARVASQPVAFFESATRPAWPQ